MAVPGLPSAFPMPFEHVCLTQDNVEIVLFNKQLYGPSKIFNLKNTTRKKGSIGGNTQTSGRGRRLDARRNGDVSVVLPWRVEGDAAHGRRLASQRRRLSDSTCIEIEETIMSTTVKPLEKKNGKDGFEFCIPIRIIDICGSITMHLEIDVPLKADLCLEQRSVELSPQPNLKIKLYVRAGGGGGPTTSAPLPRLLAAVPRPRAPLLKKRRCSPASVEAHPGPANASTKCGCGCID